MFEDNSYEPLAEVYIKLNGDSDGEDIYCLCSRVVIRGNQLEDDDIVEEAFENVPHVDYVSHYFNSCRESLQPLPLQNFRKKENEEVVSCYCSASHCSTDEHDSVRETGGGPHSDSGADLSESCSRDLDWERYWSANGEAIVWSSWVSKYGNYIDPSYQQRSVDYTDDTQFNCEQVKGFPTSERRNTFEGLLTAINEEIEPHTTPVEDTQDSINLGRKEQAFSGEVDTLGGDSSTGGSWCTDDLSEDFFRLRSASRSSGRTSLVTDSLTNVTPITISELSEESSGANSFVSSSESVSSNDLQWQQLWLEHFNEQYNRCYEIFMSKYNLAEITPPTASEILSDSVFTEELNTKIEEEEEDVVCTEEYIEITPHDQSEETESVKRNQEQNDDRFRDQNEIREENKENIEQSQQQQQQQLLINKTKKRGGRKYNKHDNRNLIRESCSVGYLLSSIRSLNVDECSTVVDKMNVNDDGTDVKLELRKSGPEELISSSKTTVSDSSNCISPIVEYKAGLGLQNEAELQFIANNSSDVSDAKDLSSNCCDQSEELSSTRSCYCLSEDAGARSTASSDVITVVNAEEPPTFLTEKKQLKRSHDKDDPSLDRVKGAMTLMGFVFKPPPSEDFEANTDDDCPTSAQNNRRVTKAHIVYRKKNIRSHNRTLNMKSIQPRHIRFGDDDQIAIQTPPHLKSADSFSSADSPMVNAVPLLPQSIPPTSSTSAASILHQDEEFSEKDDSTDETDIDMSPLSTSPRQKLVSLTEEDTSNIAFLDGEERAALRKCKRRQRSKRLRKQAFPKEIQDDSKLLKYWYKRYRLFSKFDQGIKLDHESWYSVTPEKISKHTSERCRCDLIIDACCGAGGNSIQFAFTCERVIAIDIDPAKIELARHNAAVYGVSDRIEFIVGDFMVLARNLIADVVFLSPPWGGPEYLANQEYNLDQIGVTGGGIELYKAAVEITSNICYYLPKNINTDQLLKLAAPAGAVEVEQNFLDKKLVAVTAYFGDLVESI